MSDLKEKFNKIRAFAFDVDGVFTNGTVLLHPGGEYIRMMNIKDGYAVQYAVKAGYPLAIITGGFSRMVKKRFVTLGVKDIYMRSTNKMDAYEDFRRKHGLENEHILYMGDDLPDYEVMAKSGVSTCPSDAAREIQEIAAYISFQRGGEGCVRDIIEQILRLQGKWMRNDAFIW